jgi:hypothetical protein
MKMTDLATIFLLVLAIWTAHLAGAGYILGKDNVRTYRWAISKSLFSILLIFAVVWINWR